MQIKRAGPGYTRAGICCTQQDLFAYTLKGKYSPPTLASSLSTRLVTMVFTTSASGSTTLGVVAAAFQKFVFSLSDMRRKLRGGQLTNRFDSWTVRVWQTGHCQVPADFDRIWHRIGSTGLLQ